MNWPDHFTDADKVLAICDMSDAEIDRLIALDQPAPPAAAGQKLPDCLPDAVVESQP